MKEVSSPILDSLGVSPPATLIPYTLHQSVLLAVIVCLRNNDLETLKDSGWRACSDPTVPDPSHLFGPSPTVVAPDCSHSDLGPWLPSRMKWSTWCASSIAVVATLSWPRLLRRLDMRMVAWLWKDTRGYLGGFCRFTLGRIVDTYDIYIYIFSCTVSFTMWY